MDVDEQQPPPPINQKLTFDDEVEGMEAPPKIAAVALQLNQAPASAKKKTPAKRASTGGASRKSPSKTPKLKDYFPLLTSSSSSSNISDATDPLAETAVNTGDGPPPPEPFVPPPSIVIDECGDRLTADKTNENKTTVVTATINNETPQETCATPKGSQDDMPAAATVTPDAIFATPCHRLAPEAPFDLTASLYKTPVASSLKKDRTALNNSVKKSVQFSRVNVFLFERKQGYNCIPSDSTKDAVTLGMSPRHMDVEMFDSLETFSARKREFHLEKLKEERSKILDDMRSSFLISKSLDIFNAPLQEESSSDGSTTAKSSSSSTENEASKSAAIPPELLTEIEQGIHEFIDDDDKFEKKIKEIVEKSQGAIDPFKKEDKPVFEILDNIDKYRDPEVALPINMELFLPILSPEERRQLLIESGVDIIDNEEADEITDIRESRQFCGCKCKMEEACRTEECSCYAAGISCQLDRTRFPCGCSLKRCKNPTGIKRFDMRAVIDHYTAVLTDPDTYDPLAKPAVEPVAAAPAVVKETAASENRAASKKASGSRKRKPDPLNIQPMTREQESSEQIIGSYPISPVPKRSRTSLKQIQQQQALRQVSNEQPLVAVSNPVVPKATVDQLKQLAAPVSKPRGRKKKDPVSITDIPAEAGDTAAVQVSPTPSPSVAGEVVVGPV